MHECADGSTYVEEAGRATHFRFVVMEIYFASVKIEHAKGVRAVEKSNR